MDATGIEARVLLWLASRIRKGSPKHQPEDSPIGHLEGVFLEVTLNPGSEVTSVLQKNKMQVGATKLNENGERIVGLYVPEDSLPILQSILEDYGYGPLRKSGKPPNKPRVEAISRIREANFLSFWNDDRFRLSFSKVGGGAHHKTGKAQI